MEELRLLNALVGISRRAGDAILEIYGRDFEVETKADQSPLTQADLASHRIICSALPELDAETPVLSEESADVPYATRGRWSRYWLVDPLDGTKEFISKNGEFTVNIALIDGDGPLMGVVLAPAREKAWWGLRGAGAWTRAADGETKKIQVRPTPAGGLTAVASRSHADAATEDFLDNIGASKRISAGSSLKFCLVAEGRADIYPRFGPTMEWDVAAGHAVLLAAGGHVTTLDDQPFRYRKPDFRNSGFIAKAA